MADPRKFLVNTDYPMDMCIKTFDDSISIPSGGGSASFQHGLPFTPLVGGLWSQNSTFTPAHDFSNGFAILPDSSIPAEVLISATPDNIVIESNQGGAIYYKLYCFAPPDFTGQISDFYQVESSSNFRLNSDSNYLKQYIFAKQMLEPSQTVAVNHNLGYIPVVDAWIIYTQDGTSSGAISKVIPADQLQLVWDIIHVTDTQLMLSTPSSVFVDRPQGYYYRIYYDEA